MAEEHPKPKLSGRWDYNGSYFALPVFRQSDGKLYMRLDKELFAANIPDHLTPNRPMKVEMYCDGNETVILIRGIMDDEEFGRVINQFANRSKSSKEEYMFAVNHSK